MQRLESPTPGENDSLFGAVVARRREGKARAGLSYLHRFTIYNSSAPKPPGSEKGHAARSVGPKTGPPLSAGTDKNPGNSM